jgi:hypothetical protein
MHDFAGAYAECMYLLVMAIRPEALPTDAAALTEMVLALDAENEKLRVLMRTLNDMIFGKRSERLAAIVAEQLALELDDLATGVTPPLPANDDAPATKPPASRARRRGATSARCPSTCRAASRCWSRTRRRARAARAVCTRSVRT